MLASILILHGTNYSIHQYNMRGFMWQRCAPIRIAAKEKVLVLKKKKDYACLFNSDSVQNIFWLLACLVSQTESVN